MYVPEVIDTPLDPRPCKNTPSKSQYLCLGLGIVWVRGVAVDLQFEKKALGEKGVAQNELGFWGKAF